MFRIDPEEQVVCASCIGDDYLKRQVDTEEQWSCSYCSQPGHTVSIAELASIMDRAFENHYALVDDQPSAFERVWMREKFGPGYEGDPVTFVISDAAGVEETIAEDIRKVLEEEHFDFESAKMGERNPFAEEAHYVALRPDDIEYRHSWFQFENDLKTKTRFFSVAAQETLCDVFQDIKNQDVQSSSPLVVEAGPGTEFEALYRARVFYDRDRLEAALKAVSAEIGPPPAARVTAGRMNAHGVSVFYGATNPGIAIAEVRPPVGSRVVVANFRLLARLKLLDVRAFDLRRVNGSVFDPAYRGRLERMKFLESLGERISRAVVPSDEPLEYIVTQVVADFLSVQPGYRVDGIVYPSVQHSGVGSNVVLFHGASCVERVVHPEGTRVEATSREPYDDYFEESYRIVELIPEETADAGGETSGHPAREFLRGFYGPARWEDTRRSVLRLDEEKTTVHYVDGVEYSTEDYPVRFERRVQSGSS